MRVPERRVAARRGRGTSRRWAGSGSPSSRIPPDGGEGAPADLDLAAAFAEFEQKLPGMAEHLERDDPGMHTTASVDTGVVISGSVTLELDDGATVVLHAGDTYVQNGTRHRWSNPTDTPAVIAVALIGAHHERVEDHA